MGFNSAFKGLNTCFKARHLKRLVDVVKRLDPGSIRGQSIWDLWWTNWQQRRFFSEFFRFSCQLHSSNAKTLFQTFIIGAMLF